MRYTDDDLLTHEEGRELLTQIESWCRRTGTNYFRLVTAARVPPNTRSMIRQGKRRLTIILANRLTVAMTQNPHGISKERHQRLRIPVVIARPMPTPAPDRSPCPRCGTRKDIGCKHFPVQVPMVRG